MRQVVLLTHAIHPTAMRLIEEGSELRVLKRADADGLLEEIADADALIVRMPIAAEAIRAGRRLRVVARHGVGLDYIPVQTCTELGIPVTFTPDANTESVAEHVIGGMITMAHRMAEADRAVRAGEWEWRDRALGFDLHGRTLGIIGFGRIGSRVAKMARAAFEMKVLAHDPNIAPDRAPSGVKIVSLHEVLAESDFVTLHVPLSAQTQQLLNAERIATMKPGAVVINAARGGLVDQTALAEALRSGRLFGAALDVLEEEPPQTGDSLTQLNNVLVTPHSAALTEEAMLRMGTTAAEDTLRVLRGLSPHNCANAADLAKKGFRTHSPSNPA